MIPIYRPYLSAECLKYAHEAIDSTWVSSQGKYISMASDKLEELLDVYVLPVNNGTSACHLLAKAVRYATGYGGVIVPDNVYAAAWNAFLFDGDWDLYTVPCDINTWNYDLEALDYAINHRPNSIVLIVHNIGNIINVPELKRKYPHTLFVEDNCEGFLGMYEGSYSGTASFASAISFFGNKNITSGEGGAFITPHKHIYEYVKCVHSQGQSKTRFVHDHLGYNYRITNIQAAILYGQLEVMPEIMAQKQELFYNYRNHIKDRSDIMAQTIDPNTKHSDWMFGVRVPGNSSYQQAEDFFKKANIEIRPMFYPITSHKYIMEMSYVEVGDCSNAALLNKECFILPSYPGITKLEHTHILKTLDEYLKVK